MNRKTLAALALFAVTMIWGLSYTVQDLSAAHFSTMNIVFFKGVGSLILLPYVFHKKTLDRNALLGGMIIGIFSFAGNGLQQYGLSLSSASKAGFITSLYIVIVPFIEVLSGKKLKKGAYVSMILALIGLYLLCFKGEFVIEKGDIFLFICAFAFALQIIMIDRYSEEGDPLTLAFVAQLTICLLALLFSLRNLPDPQVLKDNLPAVIFIVFFTGLLAQSVQISAQKEISPVLASLIMSLEAVFAALFAFLIMHQTLSIREISGCVLMFIAVILAELL